MKHSKLKNEKFLLDIQTKCGNIANEILNRVIDAEQTFKRKWPHSLFCPISIIIILMFNNLLHKTKKNIAEKKKIYVTGFFLISG